MAEKIEKEEKKEKKKIKKEKSTCVKTILKPNHKT